MATAKKLPSGSYRVRVYSHTDPDGKKIYESFTAPTKREAEMLAAQWQNKKDRRIKSDLTVREAIEGYINAKEGVLSPSTIRAYRIQLRNNYKLIEDKPIRKLTSEDLQIFVSQLSKTVKPKSVSNIYGLLSSALGLYLPDTAFKVTLPKKVPKRKNAPSNEDVQRLYERAPMELKKCIALGAYTSLRRGEICALTYSDIKDGVIYVTKDLVQASDKSWVLKDIPKSEWSSRRSPIPKKVMELLGTGEPDERIIKYKNPTSVTRVFTRIRDRLKMDICFHDLRHYYASIGAVLGIPDNYLSDFGGWKRGSGVMKEVYQNTIKTQEDEYRKRITDYFDDLL